MSTAVALSPWAPGLGRTVRKRAREVRLALAGQDDGEEEDSTSRATFFGNGEQNETPRTLYSLLFQSPEHRLRGSDFPAEGDW